MKNVCKLMIVVLSLIMIVTCLPSCGAKGKTLDEVKAAVSEIDPDGSKYLADKIEVMGYDMRDESLTKDQKRKIRKCFAYELYKNSDEFYTQLRCTYEYLQEIVDLTQK